MPALLGDLLPWLYSRSDALKRQLSDAVQNPMGLLAQRGAQLQEDTKPLTNGGLLAPKGSQAYQEWSDAADKLGPGLIGMTVYHGSPHLFDKFDANKIGTGEGAQAFGHGLYFAENPAVARSYAPPQRTWQQIKSGQGAGPGNLYSVDLPDEAIAKMLNLDKPLAEQSPEVQRLLSGWGAGKHQTLADFMQARQRDFTGEILADDLAKAGVPGARYLDAESRANGGTSNFVVFPQAASLLRILGRE